MNLYEIKIHRLHRSDDAAIYAGLLRMLRGGPVAHVPGEPVKDGGNGDPRAGSCQAHADMDLPGPRACRASRG